MLLTAVEVVQSSDEVVVGVWTGLVLLTKVEVVSQSSEVVGVWTGFVELTSVEVV